MAVSEHKYAMTKEIKPNKRKQELILFHFLPQLWTFIGYISYKQFADTQSYSVRRIKNKRGYLFLLFCKKNVYF